ncbi:MAG TPA: zonular occludens toxin domain-containing protein [Chromobacteriaceae bacterium]|nr:zonular occludens toxin domain-containing protein [Chromobacteriaceae bacterium]
MITFISAVPGSGKTLFLIKTLHEKAKRENRQVYYHGIDLTEEGKRVLGWEELSNPLEWYKLPPLAIIVIDECQKIFPKRPNGSRVPDHISQFETHRHLGLDIYLISQGPHLFDPHIRPLIGCHYHLLRIFGMPAAQVLRWDGCQDRPNSKSAKSECLDKSKFVYPKEVFKWYKSAEAHTHKIKIPKAVWWLLIFVAVSIAALWASFHYVGDLSKVKSLQMPGKMVASAPAGSMIQAPQQQKERQPLTPAQYMQERTPRFPDIPESEPRYDDLARPTTFPRIAMCVSSSTKCKCYTQQGTEVDLPEKKCRDNIARPQFDPYQPQQQDIRQARVDENGQQGQGRTSPPEQITPPSQNAPSIAMSDSAHRPHGFAAQDYTKDSQPRKSS